MSDKILPSLSFDMDAYIASFEKKKNPEGSRDTEDGILISKPPDYCYSPNKVIPYTIYAKQDEDANTAPTVRMTKMRSHTSGSIITKSHGDEGGTGGGIDSGCHNGPCMPKTWSKTVFIEGKNAVRHNDEWWMNNYNTFGKLYYTIFKNLREHKTKAQIEEEMNRQDVSKERVGSVTAAALPTNGYSNVAGSIEFGKWLNNAKSNAQFPGTLSGAAKIATNAFPYAAALTTYFSQSGRENVAFFDQLHRTEDPNVVAILDAARSDWDRLGAAASMDGSAKQWSNYWSGVLSDYETRAEAGDFGQTTQDIAYASKAAVIPAGMQERLSKEGVRVTGAALTAEMLPCLQFACPPQVGKYRGGAYWCTKMPTGDGLEAHHMPAKGYGNKFPAALGPSIQMDPADHSKTASHPRSGESYEIQSALLKQGENNTVYLMDAANVLAVEAKTQQYGKYATALAQATLYNDCLKKQGLIK